MIAPSRKKGFFLLFIFICIFFITGCSENDKKAKQQRFTVGLATNNPNGLKNVLGFQEAMTENMGYSHCAKPGGFAPVTLGHPTLTYNSISVKMKKSLSRVPVI